jgi:hypothetical protein
MISVKAFLSAVEQITAEEPSYRHGGSGHDGTCDCIGLVIGAIERCGGRWPGIHGSNYAAHARGVLRGLYRIGTQESLSPGDLVFKAYQPTDKGYALPARYRKGGDFFNGDLQDYYHVGVVVSVSPLRIRHMTTPKPKTDTRIGKWVSFGQLAMIGEEEVIPMQEVSYKARVIGGTLNVREKPDTSANRIGRLMVNTEVDVTGEGDGWLRIAFDGGQAYAMAKFLKPVSEGDAKETVTVDRARLEAVYDELGDILGLRG